MDDVAAAFYDWEAKQFLRRQMEDIDFYRALATQVGGPLLELGCGTGRVTLMLAAAGFDVVALDINPRMLELLSRKAGKLGLDSRIEVVEADMRSFRLRRRFPLIIIPYNTFCLLHDYSDQMACLHCVREHLAPEGRLALEVYPFQQHLREPEQPKRWLATDYYGDDGTIVTMYESMVNDFARQVTHFHREFHVFRPDRPVHVLRDTLSLRTINRFELTLLLECCGFCVEAIYGNYRFDPYPDPQVGTMLAVARVKPTLTSNAAALSPMSCP